MGTKLVISSKQVSSGRGSVIDAHETIISNVRDAIRRTNQNDDAGSNDMLMGDILRGHETQVWFIAEHLVDTPLVRA